MFHWTSAVHRLCSPISFEGAYFDFDQIRIACSFMEEERDRPDRARTCLFHRRPPEPPPRTQGVSARAPVSVGCRPPKSWIKLSFRLQLPVIYFSRFL